jgi:hypothetical protein
VSKIDLLLRDLPANRTNGATLLTPDQWDEVIRHFERGVSVKTMFAALSGKVVPFYNAPGSFASALTVERKRRRKAAQEGKS